MRFRSFNTVPGGLGRASGLILLCSLVAASTGCPSQPEDRLAEIRELHQSGQFAQSLKPLRALLDEDPGQPEANYLLGVALLRTREAGLAVWPLRKAAESPDYAVDAGLMLTRALLRGRTIEDTLNAANRVLAIEPDNTTALELRVQAYLKGSRPAEALEDIDRVLEFDPENLAVLVPRVLALIGLERIDEAGEALETARHQLETTEREVGQETQAKLCIATGLFAFEKGEVERGEAQYQECLEQFPTDQLAVSEAAAFYDRIGQRERATEVMQRAFEESRDPFFRRALAQRMRQLGKEDEEQQYLREEAEERPSPNSWFALGDHYVRREDYGAACEAFEQALAASADPPPMIRFALADTLIQAGDYEKAEQVAKGLEQASFRDLIRGRSLLAQGDARGALKAFEAGIRLWPNNAAARFLMGQAAEQLGDFDRAISEYRESLRADAARSEAGLTLARLYEAEGAYAGALEAIGKYARTHQMDPESYRVGIRIAHRLGRRELVAEGLTRLSLLPGHEGTAVAENALLLVETQGPSRAVEAIARSPLDLTDPANAAALRVLLEQLAALGEHDTAQTRIATALEAHPGEAVFHELHARALRAGGGPGALFREAFERAIELDPEYAPALAGLAEVSAEAGERAAALALYDRAAEADTDDPGPAYAAVQLLSPAQEAEEAERRLVALLELHPRHAGAANDLARILAARGQDLDRALALAQRAVLFRTAPEAPETLGWIHLLREEPGRAVEALRRALELRPEAASARYRLGLALAAQGDEQGAREAFREVIETGAVPETEQARAELARLDARGD
jgi:tetratricopeptide (TPR) repeat protein